MTIRVMLVDDQVLLRTGFRMVLAAQPDMEVVAEAGDGVEALQVVRSTEVDVVLMDVRMPKLDGVEATRRICAEPDPPKVLILTTFDLDEYAFSGLKAGASGFMLKDVPPGELLAAIRSVHSGDAVVAPSTTRRLLDRFAPMLPSAGKEPRHKGLERLTEREREVMVLVAQGCPTGRSRPGWCCPRRPSRPMWAASSPSWGCATGSRWWSWRMRRGSSARAATEPAWTGSSGVSPPGSRCPAGPPRSRRAGAARTGRAGAW